MTAMFRPGSVLNIALGAIALIVAATLATLSGLPSGRAAMTPTAQHIEVALMEVGLSPETLAAAGLTAPAVTTLIGNAVEHLDEHFSALQDARSALGSARADHDRLQRLVQSGTASAQDLTAFASAKTALSQAQAALDAQRASLSTAATANLSQPQRAVLAAIAANARWDLPTPYLVSQRTQPQWVAIRDALANERIAAKLSEEPNPNAASLLLSIRAEQATATAMTNLSANAATITTAWNSALQP